MKQYVFPERSAIHAEQNESSDSVLVYRPIEWSVRGIYGMHLSEDDH
jgi:hypothetical protein